MTPEEKAYELIDKFLNPINHLHQYPLCLEAATECALIAVEECLNTCVESMIYYWKEVKQEIEKL
jgi:hypothetical protein